ncbi:MAG: 5-amino-6-(D-ribitylamino)uracil--L-tyrosine 4-hydroxyphenyl transferase CofH [Polyangiaceae bacterium]|nr:5-amino-6-(D-ribitylamino)uracil--L-tyrosine 4-hydroxyphenyl transferase CofH [Polyangiaceae bacterium]
MSLPNSTTTALAQASEPCRAVLERCLDGEELGVNDAVTLLSAFASDLDALGAVANHLRSEQAGDVASYVINRNINFTNVCIKSCKFCAFSRVHRSEEGYFLPKVEILRRVSEAVDYGATEVCLQAGLAPSMDSGFYLRLIEGIRDLHPELHIHALSPEELKHGAQLTGQSIREFLVDLKSAGLGTIPGTSAEILDDAVRARLSGGRITTQEWIDVVSAAHELGIRSSATIMFGHLEAPSHVAAHLASLRTLQRRTGGFTEFVPLSFVSSEAPLYLKQLVPGVRAGPSTDELLAVYAVSRLMLGREFVNLQASWVKLGLPMATRLLQWGANDLGGTLMNESISTAAGADHGQFLRPTQLRSAIAAAGRTPIQRDTVYRELRRFSSDELGPSDRLDGVTSASHFGSLEALTRGKQFRYELGREPQLRR